jgi:predicted nuclease with TOPRIM domain
MASQKGNVMEDKDKIIAELKAENETLKKVKDFACINLKNYIADNNKLKAENETLKSQLDFEVQKKEVLEAENERLKLKTEELENRMQTLDDETITVEITEDEFEKYKQLKSCLQEIKTISEEFIKNVSENCIKITPMFLVHKEIIDLITKAESEEE